MTADPKGPPTGSEPKAGPGRPLRALVVACGALLVLLLLRQPPVHSYGWDESMHAALPGARLGAALREGEMEVFTRTWMDCEQYPFVFPFALALAQGIGGLGEDLARATTVIGFALAVFLLALLAGELSRDPKVALLASLLAALTAATSPMAQAFARTLFLEVPFLAVSSAALLVWVRRRLREQPSAAWTPAAWDLVASLLATAAFFTKFNYGVLFLAGLAADEGFAWIGALREGRFANQLTRSLRVAAPLAVALLWWFVLPWPGGSADAASHRAAFLGFLQGNLEMASTTAARKALHLAAYLANAPATALLLGVGVLLGAYRSLRNPGARACLLVLLSLGLPTAWHPFHLERFWLPLGVGLWPLAAFGWASFVIPRTAEVRLACLRGGLLSAVFLGSTVAAPQQSLSLAGALGLIPDDPVAREAAARVFEGWNGDQSSRTVPTAGLLREEADALLDLVAAELAPDERYAWVGLSSELSPAVLTLGLYARGGSTARLLRADETSVDIVPVPGAPEPNWDMATLGAWAANYDVLFFTDPPDLKDRADRRSVKERWHRPLVQNLGLEVRRLGVVPIQRGDGKAYDVGLFACRSMR